MVLSIDDWARGGINKRKLELTFNSVFNSMTFAIIELEREPHKHAAGTKNHSIIFLPHF